MENFDIYVYRLGDIKENAILNLPHVGDKVINVGFLGIELTSIKVYEIYIFLGNCGLNSGLIVSTKYKYSCIDYSYAINFALLHFKKKYKDLSIFKSDIEFIRENLTSYTFALNVSQQVQTYASIDKYDGHIHSKYEQNTQQQEEYYLNISTYFNIDDLEGLIRLISQKKDDTLISNNGVLSAYHFDTLYISIHNSKRTYNIDTDIAFTSNIRMNFFIPKYKVGYENGRVQLMEIINYLKSYINEGILYSNYEDFIYVLKIKNNVITFNEDWKYQLP